MGRNSSSRQLRCSLPAGFLSFLLLVIVLLRLLVLFHAVPFPPPAPHSATDLTEIYSFHENKAPVHGSPPGKDLALN